VDISKLIVTVETVSQDISEIKEKIKSYEADLQIAKEKGDKQEVKLLREDIRTEKNLLLSKENLLLSKENLLISEKNLLIELQKEKNLLIAKDSNNKGKIFSSILLFFNFSLFLNLSNGHARPSIF